jgi:hypothetical protein
MSVTQPSVSETQPRVLHKLVLRTLILVLALGALFLGFRWYQFYAGDPGGQGAANTAGMIAAIQMHEDGQEVVLFDEDGNIHRAPGWREGRTDREPAWLPSGNRLFFVSDRNGDNFDLYRWNPARDREPEQRTTGSRSRSNPDFGPDPQPDTSAEALITSGGFVLRFDPREMRTRQVLPPVDKNFAQRSAAPDEGAASQFSGVYSKLGRSFRQAKWTKDRAFIVAIMRREEGEVLVLQNMTGELQPPAPIVAGDRIDMDVDRATGQIVFAVRGFRFLEDQLPPDAVAAGKIERPFENALFVLDPAEKQPKPLAVSQDAVAFASPAFSPNGDRVAFVLGEVGEQGDLRPQALALAPVGPGAGQPLRLAEGEIFEPSWSPDGERVAFVRRGVDGKRNIHVIHRDGSRERNLSGGRGNFARPLFSPQG